MRVGTLASFLGTLGIGFPCAVDAAPELLTEAEFASQTAALPKITESFDGYPIGQAPSLFRIANGTYTGTPVIMDHAWCPFSQCLAADGPDGKFDAFPPSTAYWGTRLRLAIDGTVLSVTVNGARGSSVFVLPPLGFTPNGTFFGVHDPSGIVSVSFHQLPTICPFCWSNYSFDDVVVALDQPPAVPATSPVVLTLLALALALVAYAVGGRSLQQRGRRPSSS